MPSPSIEEPLIRPGETSGNSFFCGLLPTLHGFNQFRREINLFPLLGSKNPNKESEFVRSQVPKWTTRLKFLAAFQAGIILLVLAALLEFNQQTVEQIGTKWLSGISPAHCVIVSLQHLLLFLLVALHFGHQTGRRRFVEASPFWILVAEFATIELANFILKYRNVPGDLFQLLPHVVHCFSSLILQDALSFSRASVCLLPHCTLIAILISVLAAFRLANLRITNFDIFRWITAFSCFILSYFVLYQTELLERLNYFLYTNDTNLERPLVSQKDDVYKLLAECRQHLSNANLQSDPLLNTCERLLRDSIAALRFFSSSSSSGEDLQAGTSFERQATSGTSDVLMRGFAQLHDQPFDKRNTRRGTIAKISDPQAMGRLYRSLPSPELEINSDVVDRLGVDMRLDILEIKTREPIRSLGKHLLLRFHEEIGAHESLIFEFLERLEGMYLKLPYHNSFHGVAVAHQGLVCLSAFGLDTECESFGPLEVFAFLVACLGHDAGHPGRSTTFIRKSGDPLKIIYCEKSPLECMHAALVLSILESKAANVFAKVEPEHLPTVRRRIVQLILATDMAYSLQLTSQFKSGSASLNPTNKTDDAWQLAVMCIKAADLGHSVLPLEQHINWSLRVVEEFYQQNEEEERLALVPVDATFRRQAHDTQFIASQLVFLTILAAPVWSSLFVLHRFFVNQSMQEGQRAFESNLAHWAREKENASGREYRIPESVSSCHTSGNCILQPLLDMQQELVLRLRRETRTGVVLPGETRGRKRNTTVATNAIPETNVATTVTLKLTDDSSEID